MVSSFTTRKRLEKQNPGENSNTWGGFLNTNTIELVDECFGLVCVAMTTNGDSTLSTQNGATDQGRRSQIVLTGAPTSNVSLFVPAVQSFYLIRNKMTGAFKVNIKNTGGTNGVDFSGAGSGAEQGVVISDGLHVREVLRSVSIGAFNAFTSAVIAAVSNVALDATGGADADLLMFHDTTENGALNHVAVSTFMKNVIANAPSRVSVSPSDTLLVGNSDSSFAAANATVQLVHNSQFGLAAKTTLVAADTIGITDSAAANAARKITATNLVGAVCSLGGASQADQETGTTSNKLVTPAVQQYHPSAAKAWVTFNGAGTVSIAGGYNVSSITDNNTGNWTVNFTTSFTSTGYTAIGWARETLGNTTRDASVIGAFPSDTKSTSAFQIRTWSGEADTAIDSSEVNVVFFGDQ